MINLQNSEVIDYQELEERITINAVSATPERTCSDCSSTNTVVIGKVIQPYADTPIQNKPVKIKYSRKRLRCKDCGKTSFEHLSWLSKDFRMTQRAEEYAITRCGKVPFIRIATELDVTEGTIRNIFSNYAAELESKHEWVAPRVLGINDVKINKKEHLVITDPEKNSLLDVRKDRELVAIQNAITRLHGWQDIEIVTMSMRTPYRDAVTQLIPNAVIVVDYHHVASLVDDAMGNALKSARAKLTNKELKKFKDNQETWLKRRANITDLNELASFDLWAFEYPSLVEIYRAKEALLSMWDIQTRLGAEQHWEHWKNAANPTVSRYFKNSIKAIDNWHDEIFNWWNHPYSNALSENLNEPMQDALKNGKGISFETLRVQLLYTKA